MFDLSEFLPRERIADRWIDRLAYSRDASVYRLIPKAVIRPQNEMEVRKLLEYSRRSKVSVTFRTAGTSLSGQSVTDGLIAEVVHDWQRFKILDNGHAIKLQPGVNGSVANRVLQPYSRKIGPDPAYSSSGSSRRRTWDPAATRLGPIQRTTPSTGRRFPLL